MNTTPYYSTLYTLKVLSHLHVGNGEANYSVIDKQVQRDPLTGIPVINSSSLKGALREYIAHIDGCNQAARGNKSPEHTEAICATIFGGAPNEDDEHKEETENSKTKDDEHKEETDNSKSKNDTKKEKKPHQGKVIFHGAKLLAMPVRTDQKPYVMATSVEIVQEFVETCKIFGLICEDKQIDIGATEVEDSGMLVENEGWRYETTDQLDFIAPEVIVMRDEHFRELAKELPFVARNYLENGISENLWYEEIVPRESLFYFVTQTPVDAMLMEKEKETIEGRIKKFEAYLENAKLYIGANTTVGYGLCKITARQSNKEEANHAQQNT